MADRDLARTALREWCGADDFADSDRLRALWTRSPSFAFQPDGANMLSRALQAAFTGRKDKRRVTFLHVHDFAGQGWNLETVADLVDFITAHTEDRVIKVLQGWSGIDIPDTSVTVCSLWAARHASACSFGIADLIDRLAKEFRELKITLIPDDFGDDGDIQTIDDLIGAVAGSPSKPGGAQ